MTDTETLTNRFVHNITNNVMEKLKNLNTDSNKKVFNEIIIDLLKSKVEIYEHTIYWQLILIIVLVVAFLLVVYLALKNNTVRDNESKVIRKRNNEKSLMMHNRNKPNNKNIYYYRK